MTLKQATLYGVTPKDWKAARDRVREAIPGGRATYMARIDRLGNNGKRCTILKVVKRSREIEVRFDDGGVFRAFGHNIVLG